MKNHASVNAVLAYALLDRVWKYLNATLPTDRAARRDLTLGIISAAGDAVLEAVPNFSERVTISQFNMLTYTGKD